MILIAHRGNLSGPDPDRENSPDYINEALAAGFDVEIDLWYGDGKLWLGHDTPLHPIDDDFLQRPGLWCHAKNIMALEKLIDLKVHCFFHDGDAVTLTSHKYLWTYPGAWLTPRSICVLPKIIDEVAGCAGICSDYVQLRRDR